MGSGARAWREAAIRRRSAGTLAIEDEKMRR